jgi:hypothetical protein
MKNIKLALKFILLHIIKLFNDFMIFITNKKVDWFRKNKVKIACAIITILAIANLNTSNQLSARDMTQMTCYDVGPSTKLDFEERDNNFNSGFLDTLKAIFFIK